MILVYDLVEYDWLCLRLTFSLWEYKHVITHRGTQPAHPEVETIIKIQFDLLFKITVRQEIIPSNSYF